MTVDKVFLPCTQKAVDEALKRYLKRLLEPCGFCHKKNLIVAYLDTTEDSKAICHECFFKKH